MSEGKGGGTGEGACQSTLGAADVGPKPGGSADTASESGSQGHVEPAQCGSVADSDEGKSQGGSEEPDDSVVAIEFPVSGRIMELALMFFAACDKRSGVLLTDDARGPAAFVAGITQEVCRGLAKQCLVHALVLLHLWATGVWFDRFRSLCVHCSGSPRRAGLEWRVQESAELLTFADFLDSPWMVEWSAGLVARHLGSWEGACVCMGGGQLYPSPHNVPCTFRAALRDLRFPPHVQAAVLSAASTEVLFQATNSAAARATFDVKAAWMARFRSHVEHDRVQRQKLDLEAFVEVRDWPCAHLVSTLRRATVAP